MTQARGRGAAHGKVILLGEHAVVYGAPALAAGIDRGAIAEAVRCDGPSVLEVGGERVTDGDLERAFSALLAEGPALPSGFDVKASSELPSGGGLGSSAALGVAIARAVMEAAGERGGDTIRRATAWERIFHGNPSGIDTAAAAFGGALRFSRATGAHPVALARDLIVCVGWSGAGSSTKEMVEGVARLRARKPAIVDQAVLGITSLVENGAHALEAGDLSAFGKLLDLNQMILAGLFLSTERIEALCSIARANGALGAKLTGAGGGGSTIALAADERGAEKIVDAWKKDGFSGFVTRIAASALARSTSRSTRTETSMTATAVAHPNIALAKYWGKREDGHNLPAVPSLSITLAGMSTTTTVTFDPALRADELEIGGTPAKPGQLARAVGLFDRVRAAAKLDLFARAVSANDFPTAAGLASSASAFAALAVAATSAAGLSWSRAELSDLARKTSVSSARSLFGAFVTLRAGLAGEEVLAAEPFAEASALPIRVIVAVTREGEKGTLSSAGMLHTQRTSPYYAAWVDDAPNVYARIRSAITRGDFEALGVAAEESALRMHAAAIAAAPSLVYWTGATVAVLAEVNALRRRGVLAFATIDAGPHVKVLVRPEDEAAVTAAIAAVPGVLRVIAAAPGEGARLVEP